jgi:hypothetical protein
MLFPSRCCIILCLHVGPLWLLSVISWNFEIWVLNIVNQCTLKYYSLRPIILFANVDVSRHILVVDTSVLAKSNMGWREYVIYTPYLVPGFSTCLACCFLNSIPAVYHACLLLVRRDLYEDSPCHIVILCTRQWNQTLQSLEPYAMFFLPWITTNQVSPSILWDPRYSNKISPSGMHGYYPYHIYMHIVGLHARLPIELRSIHQTS